MEIIAGKTCLSLNANVFVKAIGATNTVRKVVRNFLTIGVCHTCQAPKLPLASETCLTIRTHPYVISTKYLKLGVVKFICIYVLLNFTSQICMAMQGTTTVAKGTLHTILTMSAVDGVGSWSLLSLKWRHNERGSVSNNQRLHFLSNCRFRSSSKKTSKFRVTGLCAGISPVTGELPTQRARNAENVSIWWRHHVHDKTCWSLLLILL